MPNSDPNDFDVIVIGAGHAGCEAALAAARLGRRVALVTLSAEHIAHLPCNPSIGGIGKGQLVREIDALGGAMGCVADQTALQIKKLNHSKGPAVQALRAQVDKIYYPRAMRAIIEAAPGLELIIGEAAEVTTRQGVVSGVILNGSRRLTAAAVVLTAGTFLRGSLTIGPKTWPGGRMGEIAAAPLAASLQALGLETGRFQTATPPRVRRDSVDFTAVRAEPGSAEPLHFSFISGPSQPLQLPCHLTHTTPETHDVIRRNIMASPIKSGAVGAHGPRNCPSIDRKVINFPEKESHPVFIEPESLESAELYLQGLTTAMPEPLQEAIIRTVPGLEKAIITRPGYAVSYDYLPPCQLGPDLQAKTVPGLFAAGQVNGTTGYEEAAAQGLLAGLNAARWTAGEPPITIGRDQAYIGVMVDDLVTQGVAEPYRVYTSRAEFRLLLRSDNADQRLTPLAIELGLADATRRQRFASRQAAIKVLEQTLAATKLRPSASLNARLAEHGGGPITQGASLAELLRRPGISLADLSGWTPVLDAFEDDVKVTATVDIKYAGYVKREVARVARHQRQEGKPIPADLDYHQLRGISFEARERLTLVRPLSLGQASRVSGVSPADVSILMVHLERIDAKHGA